MFESPRTFKFWDYNVSHKQALIRSPRSSSDATNIDLVFLGVEFMSVPTMMNGINLVKVKDYKIPAYRPSQSSDVYTIRTGGKQYLIAAVAYKVLENTLEVMESCLESAEISEDTRDLGRILASSKYD